jgi:hypothetical protein
LNNICNGREDKVRQVKTRRYTGKMCILTLGLQRGKWGSIYRKGGSQKACLAMLGYIFTLLETAVVTNNDSCYTCVTESPPLGRAPSDFIFQGPGLLGYNL